MSKPSGRPYHVLFVDTGNAGPSIIAEALLDHWGRGRFKGFSAGSHPTGRLDEVSLSLLQQFGLPTSHLHSKNCAEFQQPDAPVMDFVFIVGGQGTGEAWPAWPGQPIVAEWNLPDPQTASGGTAERMLAHREVFQMIERRVQILTSLRLDSYRRRDVQKVIRDIEQTDTAEAA